MKPAGWRTTAEWRARIWWRWLLLARYAVEESIERWWMPDGPPDHWDEHALNELMAAAAPVAAAGMWVGPNWSLYPDGRSDVWVEPLGKEYEWRMVDAYLSQLASLRNPVTRPVLPLLPRNNW